jgi:hypothetical protein
MSTRIKARIPEAAMADLANDIDAAIRDRDLTRLAAFAAEAEKTAGMDQAGARAREVLSLLESKAGRDELDRLKAATGLGLRPWVKAADPSPRREGPSIAELIRRSDVEQMSRTGPFSVNDHERLERERAETLNKQLRERNVRHEEQRRRQVKGDVPDEPPWWRR